MLEPAAQLGVAEVEEVLVELVSQVQMAPHLVEVD
jgi:hypothetical protein